MRGIITATIAAGLFSIPMIVSASDAMVNNDLTLTITNMPCESQFNLHVAGQNGQADQVYLEAMQGSMGQSVDISSLIVQGNELTFGLGQSCQQNERITLKLKVIHPDDQHLLHMYTNYSPGTTVSASANNSPAINLENGVGIFMPVSQ